MPGRQAGQVRRAAAICITIVATPVSVGWDTLRWIRRWRFAAWLHAGLALIGVGLVVGYIWFVDNVSEHEVGANLLLTGAALAFGAAVSAPIAESIRDSVQRRQRVSLAPIFRDLTKEGLGGIKAIVGSNSTGILGMAWESNKPVDERTVLAEAVAAGLPRLNEVWAILSPTISEARRADPENGERLQELQAKIGLALAAVRVEMNQKAKDQDHSRILDAVSTLVAGFTALARIGQSWRKSHGSLGRLAVIFTPTFRRWYRWLAGPIR